MWLLSQPVARDFLALHFLPVTSASAGTSGAVAENGTTAMVRSKMLHIAPLSLLRFAEKKTKINRLRVCDGSHLIAKFRQCPWAMAKRILF